MWGGAVPAILGAGALALGVAILLAPWWLDNVRDLSRERRERVRVEERAKTRRARARLGSADPDPDREVRAESRATSCVSRGPRSANCASGSSLPNTSVDRDDADDTFAQQFRRIESDVENDYGVTVELVVVGDCPGR